MYELMSYVGEDKFVQLVGVKEGHIPSGEITIPGSVTLDGVKYPVKRIGDVYHDHEWFKYKPAFSDFPEITKVNISSPIEEIAPLEFTGCTGITEFHVNAGNRYLSDMDGILLHRNEEEHGWDLFRVPPGRGKVKYTVPEDICNVLPFAFSDNTTIRTVILSGSQYLYTLWSYGNRSINTIELSNSTLYTLKDGMLYKLYEVVDSKPTFELVTCPPRLRLDSYMIPENCVKVRTGAFASTVIPEIKIHDKCRLDTYVFAGSKIKTLKYNKDRQAYPAGLCIGCKDLEKTEITGSASERTIIYDDMFRDCPKMTELSVPSYEIAVMENAFNGCGIKSFPWEKAMYIEGAESLDEMNYNCFTFANSGIEQIVFPSRFYCVPNYFASGSRNLKSVILDPDGTGETKAIGHHAFENCTALESMEIRSVTDLGYKSFYGCGALKRIVFAERDDDEEIYVGNPFEFADGVRVYIGGNRYRWSLADPASNPGNATFISSSLTDNAPAERKRVYCPGHAKDAFLNSYSANDEVVEMFSMVPTAQRPALLIMQNTSASELSLNVTGVTIGGEKAVLSNGFWSIEGTGAATDRDITVSYTVDGVDMSTTYPAGELSGIEPVRDNGQGAAAITGIYTPDGRFQGRELNDASGILIIRYGDGTARRIYKR